MRRNLYVSWLFFSLCVKQGQLNVTETKSGAEWLGYGAVREGAGCQESCEQVKACPAFRGQDLSRHAGMCLHIKHEVCAMQSALWSKIMTNRWKTSLWREELQLKFQVAILLLQLWNSTLRFLRVRFTHLPCLLGGFLSLCKCRHVYIWHVYIRYLICCFFLYFNSRFWLD